MHKCLCAKIERYSVIITQGERVKGIQKRGLILFTEWEGWTVDDDYCTVPLVLKVRGLLDRVQNFLTPQLAQAQWQSLGCLELTPQSF